MEITRARPSLFGDIAHVLGFWSDRSAVHEAAAQGRALQLQQLIQGGAAVNIVAVDSITPLHEACIQGQTQCVRLLLEAGAQVDARNIDGSTPLCDACAAGSLECVKLLLKYGATVNPPLFTFSPLHEACMGGNSDCVQVMIDEGAFMEAHDCHFGTPLHVACARQHYDCVKVLLNAGANVNAAKLHETALHHAAKVKNNGLIELLVEFGGNVYARDNLDKKPIHYTSQGSPSYLCLEFYESTPLSLEQMSRVVLRRSLGTRALEAVSKLGLPSRIVHFLSYTPPPVIDLDDQPTLDTTYRELNERGETDETNVRNNLTTSKLGPPSRIVHFLSYTPPPVIDLDDQPTLDTTYRELNERGETDETNVRNNLTTSQSHTT